MSWSLEEGFFYVVIGAVVGIKFLWRSHFSICPVRYYKATQIEMIDYLSEQFQYLYSFKSEQHAQQSIIYQWLNLNSGTAMLSMYECHVSLDIWWI